MNLNWDGIKFLFQIPLEWFRKIHDRVFKAYGSGFLTVKEGYYGGTEIGIDDEAFAAAVQANSAISGYVDLDTAQDITGVKTFRGGLATANAANTQTTEIAANNIDMTGSGCGITMAESSQTGSI